MSETESLALGDQKKSERFQQAAGKDGPKRELLILLHPGHYGPSARTKYPSYKTVSLLDTGKLLITKSALQGNTFY
jgi:hypothetical protein